MKSLWQLGFVVLLMLAGASLAHAQRSTTYYHTDGLGSVVAASNDAGALQWRKEYAPFGEQTDSTDENEKLAYTGKQHDDATGLTYFGARYYDPHLGRFMGVDPVGFVESNPMSFNRYAYVNNNPYKYVDPDGEFLNFAAKFVLDVGVNVAFNYVTTGQMDVGGALKESAVGILNPAKTIAKAGKLATALSKAKKGGALGMVAKKGGADVAAAAPQPNRIYSARELLRRADEPGPLHNFPESFNAEIFQNGTKTVTPNFWKKDKLKMSNDSIMYSLPGNVNGRAGNFEIAVRPSTSGNTEVIMHRFFKPNS